MRRKPRASERRARRHGALLSTSRSAETTVNLALSTISLPLSLSASSFFLPPSFPLSFSLLLSRRPPSLPPSLHPHLLLCFSRPASSCHLHLFPCLSLLSVKPPIISITQHCLIFAVFTLAEQHCLLMNSNSFFGVSIFCIIYFARTVSS